MAGIPQTDTVERADSGTGSDNAASVSLGETRTLIGVYWEVTGSATLTVEAMVDGSWVTFDTVSLSSGSDIEIYETPYEEMRAHVDQNRTKVVITSKGVS